jgi:hypothetical protein
LAALSVAASGFGSHHVCAVPVSAAAGKRREKRVEQCVRCRVRLVAEFWAMAARFGVQRCGCGRKQPRI